MIRLTIQVVLLLAIGSSQILGGISCCCLRRSFIENLTSEFSKESARPALQRISCSKCLVKQSKPSRANSRRSAVRHLQDETIREGGRCSCLQIVLALTGIKNPHNYAQEHILWSVTMDCAASSRILLGAWSDKFEIPLRFGGRRWQAMACVWRN